MKLEHINKVLYKLPKVLNDLSQFSSIKVEQILCLNALKTASIPPIHMIMTIRNNEQSVVNLTYLNFEPSNYMKH